MAIFSLYCYLGMDLSAVYKVEHFEKFLNFYVTTCCSEILNLRVEHFK